MKALTKAQKNMVGGGLAVVVGLALLKRKLGENVAATAVANANAQVEAQQAINDAVVTATAPPPSVAGLDGLGYTARQAVMRSPQYRNRLAATQQAQKSAKAFLLSRGSTLAGAHHTGQPNLFRRDMHEPWNRVAFDSSLNYAMLEGAGPSGALPGMGFFGKLGEAISSALPGMGDPPVVPPVDQALNSMASTINASIGLVSGAVIIGLAVWGLKK
jgi:hypothetical protein